MKVVASLWKKLGISYEESEKVQKYSSHDSWASIRIRTGYYRIGPIVYRSIYREVLRIHEGVENNWVSLMYVRNNATEHETCKTPLHHILHHGR